jgi:hypothetical protein
LAIFSIFFRLLLEAGALVVRGIFLYSFEGVHIPSLVEGCLGEGPLPFPIRVLPLPEGERSSRIVLLAGQHLFHTLFFLAANQAGLAQGTFPLARFGGQDVACIGLASPDPSAFGQSEPLGGSSSRFHFGHFYLLFSPAGT